MSRWNAKEDEVSSRRSYDIARHCKSRASIGLYGRYPAHPARLSDGIWGRKCGGRRAQGEGTDWRMAYAHTNQTGKSAASVIGVLAMLNRRTGKHQTSRQ